MCAALVSPGSRVLDAGCGTGRVAIRLSTLGYACVGVDLDESMLAEARRALPEGVWLRADLATLDHPARGIPADFDLVVAAGNVIPLLAAGTEPDAVARLAAHLRTGGLLVAGFGLDAAHRPVGAARLDLATYDRWSRAAGLLPHRRYAIWAGTPYRDGGYAVSVHRASDPPTKAACCA